MAFLDQLRSARLAPVAVMQQFVLYYRADPEGIFAFIEGADDRHFLQYELQSRSQGGLANFITCNGKAGVLRALDNVSRLYPAVQRALFFVDRDFDDFIAPQLARTHPQLYITDWYSIENDVVNEGALRTVFCQLGNLAGNDARLDAIIRRFDAAHRRFAVILRRYLAAAIVFLRAGREVHLNNIDLGRALRLDPDCGPILNRHRVADIAAMAGLADVAIDVAATRMQMRALLLPRVKLWLRGKFELWFFVRFVDCVSARLRGQPVGGGRTFPRAELLTVGNAVQVLAGRVPYPDSLLQFLDRTVGDVKGSASGRSGPGAH